MRKSSVICLLLTAIGLIAGIYAMIAGHDDVYGISREIPWGILISSSAFFATLSIGLCMLAAMCRAPGLTSLAPFTNRAVYLSIVTLVPAVILILFSIENPWRMLIYNAISPNITSNIWWLSTLYGIMAGCMFLAFSSITTGTGQPKLLTSILGAVAGVGANNNLGALYTAALDPPIWYGAQLLVYFLASTVLAGASGATIFTVLAAALQHQDIKKQLKEACLTAGVIMAFALAILLVVTVSRFSAIFIGKEEPGRIAVLALMTGPLALHYWIMEIGVGIILPLCLLAFTKIKDVRAIAIAAGAALTGVFFQRYNLIIAGQIVPKLSGWDNFPTYLTYTPSLTELIIVIGAIGIAGLGFLLGEKYLGRILKKIPTL